jgi:predicted dienelactone hydrolase
MEMAVMFPSTGGSARLLGENPVFHGTTVHENAEPLTGKHPVVLLSHGWGGNFARMSWLASGLVERGAIVVAVNHPNSTTGDLDNLDALNHWTRAQDLTAALDRVLQDPQFKPVIDATRIYAAGFSYGGWTALSLGGLEGQRDGLDKFCSEGATVTDHCRDILRAGIKISELDGEAWQASYKDRRIAGVAAIDAALTWGLTVADTDQLDVPVLLIGLGDRSDRLHATDTSSSGSSFELLYPGAQVEVIAPASHFTALGSCKPSGAEILVEEKDDPVCTDPPGTDRKDVMAKIIGLISDHFKLD